MIGNFRWNLLFALAGGLLTFFNSISRNILTTSLLKCGFSFIAFFCLAYLFRWLLGTVAGLKEPLPQRIREQTGFRLDMTTPDETGELQDMLKPGGGKVEPDDDDFAPLTPPKLATKKEMDPEELANALRRMSEDEGG